MFRFSTAAILLASLAAACASKESQPPTPAQVVARTGDSDALLNYARATRRTEGCAAAAPAYRVVAAFGEGYEIAAYELADCLFDIAAAGPEAELLEAEAFLALERAAWANVARAQARLAAELATAPGREVEALGWALVYGDHADHKAFGLPSFDVSVAGKLRAAVGAEGASEAEAFAATYEPVFIAPFAAPQAKRASAPTQARPQQIRRRRR